MLPATTRRTRSGEIGLPSKPGRNLRGTNIARFGRVSKPAGCNIGKASAKKESPIVKIEVVLPSISRKRKTDETPATPTKKVRQDIKVNPLQDIILNAKADKKPTIPTLSEPIKSTSATQGKRDLDKDDPALASAVTLDEDQAKVLLDRLKIASPAQKRRQTRAASANTAALPQELLDLLNLQAALLKTLSLHYAHNGINVPVDAHAICPTIAQAWGKRKVTIEDIRLSIGILSWAPKKPAFSTQDSPLLLHDYGRRKLCIELGEEINGLSPLQEQKLKARFEANLRTLWADCGDAKNVRFFLSQLPKAVITDVTQTTSPLLARGQRNLDELKKGIARKQKEKDAQAAVQAAAQLIKPDGSTMSLLERIRFKQQQLAQMPKGPTPEELHRRAILQRAEEIAGVVSMLATAAASGQARASFPMAMVMLKIKDSLRIPIAQGDGAECVRMLAREVAPQWLRVLKIGGHEYVIVQMAFQPSKAVVEAAVNALL